jgi:hypothetical protein
MDIEVDFVGCEELKQVMVLGEWEYRAKHIPGSLRIGTV